MFMNIMLGSTEEDVILTIGDVSSLVKTVRSYVNCGYAFYGDEVVVNNGDGVVLVMPRDGYAVMGGNPYCEVVSRDRVGFMLDRIGGGM